MNYYYRDVSGKEIGPLPLGALAKLRFAGVINGDTPVRGADSTAWQICREIIADVQQPVAAPAPVAAASAGKSGLMHHGWALFALSALCFLLPFVDISCQGKKVRSFTGQQLVMGTVFSHPADPWSGEQKTEEVEPVPAAQWALGLGVAALILAMARQRVTSVLSGLAGAGSIACLFGLKSILENDIATQGKGLLTLNIREGFWLSCVLLAGGIITQFKFFSNAPTGESVSSLPSWTIPRSYKIAFAILTIVAGLAYGGRAAYQSLSKSTKISFDLTLDGKPLLAGARPVIRIDSEPILALGRKFSGISLGRHSVSVQLENAEPFERTFWVFYGDKNLGVLPLESSKGTLSVVVNPSPAKVIIKRGNDVVQEGAAPLTTGKLPVGNYVVVAQRGEYEESRSVTVSRQQVTESKIDLELGSVDLSTDPPDAGYKLSGNGRNWQGSLPAKVDDVSTGNYVLVVNRKGWDLSEDVSIRRGVTTPKRVVFPYGAIEVTSEPTGLLVSTNGIEIGKTPTTIREIRPGKYALAITDGENDLLANVTVGNAEAAKHNFAFRYSKFELSSTPPGATVTRKGKVVGKTPLTIEHVPVGDTAVELRLDGYLPTNFPVRVTEGVVASVTARLVSVRYVQAMQQAREALAAGKLSDARNFVAIALGEMSNDATATALTQEIATAERVAEAARQAAERKAQEARQLADQKEITDFIEKAITAAGGREALEKFQAFESSVRYTVKKKGMTINTWDRWVIQLPDKARLIQEETNEGLNAGPIRIVPGVPGVPVTKRSVYCVAGRESWLLHETPNGPIMGEMSDSYQRELQCGLYFVNCRRLVPLLARDIQLEKLPVADSAFAPTISIKATTKAWPDLTLVFESDSSRLVAVEYTETDQDGVNHQGRVKFSSFQNVAGVQWPMRATYSRDGNVLRVENTESMTPVNRFSDNTFNPPRSRH